MVTVNGNNLFSEVLNQHSLGNSVDDVDVSFGSSNFDLHCVLDVDSNVK